MAHLSLSQSAHKKLLEPTPYLPPLLSAPTRQEYYSRDVGNEQNVGKESSRGSTVDGGKLHKPPLIDVVLVAQNTDFTHFFAHATNYMCNLLHKGLNLRLSCLRENQMIGDHQYFFILDCINFQD